MVTAALLLCAGGGAAAQKVDINQLKGLDVPEGLKQFLGSMVIEMRGMEDKAHAVEIELRQKNALVQAKLEQVTKDKEALENKTQVVEAELRKENAALSITVTDLQNQAKTNSARLDQCEADTHPFIQEMNRRRIQEDTLCRGSGLTAMFQACCPSGSAGNGHRILQLSEGCDALPETCSATCAPLFIEYFEGCQGMLDDLAPDQRQMFVGFYSGCQEVEQAAAAMLQDARPAMIFHVVVMNEAAAQQAQMFGGGSAPAPPIGPIGPVPPSPSPARGAQIAQEFRRVCTTTNLTICVPQCNRLTYGFLLSIEIDGRGTVMTCNKMGILFSWQGQASLGGYIGDDFQAFFASVVSGAAGTYLTTLHKSENTHTDFTCQPGQSVNIHGDQALPFAPSCCGGANNYLRVSTLASLSLSYVKVGMAPVLSHGALWLSLERCNLTFSDPLMLHVVEARFVNQLFNGPITAPGYTDNTASIIDSSITFTASVFERSGRYFPCVIVENEASLSVFSTTFASQHISSSDVFMVKVYSGGKLTVEDSTLMQANGDSTPFPCDGELESRTCLSAHTGPVIVDRTDHSGGAQIWLTSPLVCDAADCVSLMCCSRWFDYPVGSSQADQCSSLSHAQASCGSSRGACTACGANDRLGCCPHCCGEWWFADKCDWLC
eukprot:SAG11_NODE_1266_length_5342_cov_4.156369_3_plen_663_part_00